jgi:hypothetical protein
MHLSRRQSVISAVLACAAVFYGVLAVKGDSSQNALRARGVHTKGVVVDRLPNGRGADTVVVRFTTRAGHQVDEELPSGTFVDDGDNVSLVYDPVHPANVKLSVDVSTEADDRGAFIFGTFVCTLLLALTLADKLKWRRRQRAVGGAPRQPLNTAQEGTPPGPGHRSAGEQLRRSPAVMHASWLTGLAVLLTAGGLLGGFNIAGLIFLALVFLPVIVAWRRDRLSFPIIFGSIFLPTWPWALYKAVSRAPKAASTSPA